MIPSTNATRTYGSVFEEDVYRSKKAKAEDPMRLQDPFRLRWIREPLVWMFPRLVVPLATFLLVAFVTSHDMHIGSSHANQVGLSTLVGGTIAGWILACFCRGEDFFAPSSSLMKMLLPAIFYFDIGCIVGFCVGDNLRVHYFAPFHDVSHLNSYPSVDPATYWGQQMMDAGRIDFLPGSRVELPLSYGFKNKDVYCVAPIVGPHCNLTLDHYDFWAVGLNCCSGHANDFRCGEYMNKRAHKGLRLMREDQREFFMLAVKQAEVVHNIKASHPHFLYLLEYPEDEMESWNHDGWVHFTRAFFCFLAALLFVQAFFFFDDWFLGISKLVDSTLTGRSSDELEDDMRSSRVCCFQRRTKTAYPWQPPL